MMGRISGIGEDSLPPDPDGSTAVSNYFKHLLDQESTDALNSLPIPTILYTAPGAGASSVTTSLGQYLPWIVGIGGGLLLLSALKR